jgi:hypothetical protein
MRRLLYPVDEQELIRIEKRTRRIVEVRDLLNTEPGVYLQIHNTDFHKLVNQLRDEWDLSNDHLDQLNTLSCDLDEITSIHYNDEEIE